MTPAERQAADLGDALGLLRACLADDLPGAAGAIGALWPHEVLGVLGALLQLGSGFLQDLSRLTGDSTDDLLDQLLTDLQRRST